MVNWKGDFKSEASIREFAPLVSDEPEALGGTDSGPYPLEKILAAYGNCLAVGYAANATIAGIEIKDSALSLRVTSTFTPFLNSKRAMLAEIPRVDYPEKFFILLSRAL